MRMARIVALSLTLPIAPTNPAIAADAIRFPVIFDGPSRLLELGIDNPKVDPNGDTRRFSHRCYYTGPDGYTLTVSNAFLGRYKQRGFTLNSLCLGLTSEIRFDPETGKSLATYVVVDRQRLDRALAGRAPKDLRGGEFNLCCNKPGMATLQLPMALPDCFKGGRPYSDCIFRFDTMTGEKLTPSETKDIRVFGETLDAAMAIAITKKVACGGGITVVGSKCRDPVETDDRGFLQPEIDNLVLMLDKNVPSQPVKKRRTNLVNPTFADVTTTLPRGYGYALGRVSRFAPNFTISISTTDLQAALGSGDADSQVDQAQLQQALNP